MADISFQPKTSVAPNNMIIGIDFDNTIACYDDVFAPSAIEAGILPATFVGAKKLVRDTLREKPGGEMEWQHLQGVVYGRHMHKATMFKGLGAFLKICRDQRVPIFIISHKTRTNKFDPERIDLRKAALSWMDHHRFFDPEHFGIDQKNVFFEDDRDKKIAKLKTTPCTHFIDDLIEVLSEPAFPEKVQRILFDPAGGPDVEIEFMHARSWDEISKIIFGAMGDT